jgi:hypothetical protein
VRSTGLQTIASNIRITVTRPPSDMPGGDRPPIAATAGVSAAAMRGADVVLFYSIVTVWFTWPLAPGLATRVVAHFDPPFSAWRLARVVHNAREGHPLFDGEIFWPAPLTLAYSDAMLAPATLAWPLLAAGLPPLAVANLLMLASIVGSAAAAYVLARRLSGHTGSAVVAGLVFAFAPYRRDHAQHLELQFALWTPLALWAWHRALERGTARDGLLCAACLLLQLLSCVYYGLFLAVALAVICPLTLIARRRGLGKGALAGLAVGLFVVAAAAAAYRQPYALARDLVGERDLVETARYSADPSSYLAATPDNILYGSLTSPLGDNEKRLFPGLTPMALSVAALIPSPTSIALIYGTAAVVAWDASLGTSGRVFPLLRDWLTPFRSVRAPARFAMLVLLGLSVLTAIGLSQLARRFPRRSVAMTTIAAGLVIMEYCTAPLVVQTIPTERPPVYEWLNQQPRQVTLELPTPRATALPLHDAFYMYAQTWHWQPLANGYSGHYTDAYIDLLKALVGLPDALSSRVMARIGIQRVILHRELFPARQYDALVEALAADPDYDLLRVTTDHLGEARVYAFVPGFGPRDGAKNE